MNNFKKYIFTGLMSIIPISITAWIIKKLFLFFSGPGNLLLNFIFTEDLISNFLFLSKFYEYLKHIFGFILTIFFLYVLGIIVKNVIGKRIYNFFEQLLSSIPIINKIYNTTKNIINTISNSKGQSFTKVVLIEYPKKDLWTLAMVTGDCKDKKNNDYYNLFVPTTPNPTSGYMIIIKKTNAFETNISVDEGLSIIISGGMVGPDIINM